MKRAIQFFTVLWIALSAMPAKAQSVPSLINYQGQLLDAAGNPMPTGDYEVQVQLFTTESGGAAIWGPQSFNGQSGTGLGPKVAVVQGRFNLVLGPQDTSERDLASVFADNPIAYIELKVGAGNPITPRQQVLSAPYALNAANAQTAVNAQIATNALNAANAQNAVNAKNATNAMLAASAVNADNATKLAGFDWSSCYDGGDPKNGGLNVAGITDRGSLVVAGGGVMSGAFTIQGAVATGGTLFPAGIGATHLDGDMVLNDHGLYLRALGDSNHFLSWGDARGNQSGFDGTMLIGLNGGVLGTSSGNGDWTLRWNRNGSVQTRGTFSQGSDRNIKENFTEIDAKEVLAKVATLPITRWNYKDDPAAPHLGPVAQDFKAAFDLGSDDKFISTVDENGVALAAIQALNQKLEDKEKMIRALEQRMEKMEQLLDKKTVGGQ